MLRTDKERVVEEIVAQLRGAETMLIADYRGLTHKELDAVRTELLKSGARFSVVKNSLTKRAAEAAGIDGLEEFLTGPTAIAFVADGDMVAVAKTLSDTAQQTRRMSLKGGILQGKSIDGDAVRDLASLPPTDVLRGQLLGAIVGPVSAIVSIFAAPMREFVGVIDARIRQLEELGETATLPAGPPPEETTAAEEPADESAAPAEASAAEAVAEDAPESTPEASGGDGAAEETTNGKETESEED